MQNIITVVSAIEQSLDELLVLLIIFCYFKALYYAFIKNGE